MALLFGFLAVAQPSAYAAENIYTGSSDADTFPATMDGGAAITYQADTITFGTLGHPGTYIPTTDTVDLPVDARRGRGDFEYTMDLAMTDLDGLVGFYGQGISVGFPNDGDGTVGINWREESLGDFGAYVENKCVTADVFGTVEQLCGLEGAGAGAISLRLSKSGSTITASYRPAGGDWTEIASIDLDTTAYDATGEWSLSVHSWGEDGFAFGPTNHVVNEISITFTPTAMFTGSSDTDQFPATMDGGAAITYQADTITFGTLGHPGTYIPTTDSVALPSDVGMGVGDFEYTMDLAMTDLDGLVGFYGQGISVGFPNDGDGTVGINWREESLGDFGAYVENKCVTADVFGTVEQVCGLEGAGAGAISLRLSKAGSTITASYMPSGGDWTEIASIDLDTTAYDATGEWSLSVHSWGEDGFAFGPTNHVVNEISITFTPTAMFTGSSDTDQFPATMDGGAAITYQADTITFGTLGHPGTYIPTTDSVALPSDVGMGVGDFEYTMDLAMTDLDGLVGFYGQGISVGFPNDGDGTVGINWREESLGDFGAYVENKCVTADVFGTVEQVCGLEGAGAGAISLRLSKAGSTITASYMPSGGDWTDLASVDLGTTAYDATGEWSLSVHSWGEDGFAFGPTSHVVDEIRVTMIPTSKVGADPVITLAGDAVVELNMLDEYVEAGATAEDAEDGDISADIVESGDVDTATAGTYTIMYSVTDSDANTVRVTRTVNVSPVGESPVILLTGDAVVTHPVGSAYVDAGASADDAEDGDITLDIVATDDLDLTTVGTYTITYNVIDSNGNEAAEVTRTVNVVDNVAPVITLLGAAAVQVGIDDTYVDAGATASDNVDGDLTAGIVVGGDTLDTSVLDTYTINYSVSDAAGNAATEVTRTVYIVDPVGPVVTLIDDAEVLLAVGGTYVEMGATAKDGVDGTLANVVIGGDTVNTSVAGTYVVEYTVTDAVGNATVATRTVTVDADLATYTVSVEYNLWPLNAVRLDVGDITVSVSGQTKNLTTENGQVEFALADDGTIYVYTVTDTREVQEYETTEVSSSDKAVTITLGLADAEAPPDPAQTMFGETSSGCFVDTIGHARVAGNSSAAFLPAGILGRLALIIFMFTGGKMRRFFSLTALFLGLLIVAAPSSHALDIFQDENIYTGSGDAATAMFSDEMDGGSSITYQADTITFGSLADGDTVDLPSDLDRVGEGDFEYAVDLAGTAGVDSQGIGVRLIYGGAGASDAVSIVWKGTDCVAVMWPTDMEEEACSAVGAGGISLKLAKTGGTIAGSYMLAGGDWILVKTLTLDDDIAYDTEAAVPEPPSERNWVPYVSTSGDGTAGVVNELRIVYLLATDESIYTGSGDAEEDKFPAQAPSGAPITYGPFVLAGSPVDYTASSDDTITFSTLYHGGTYVPPSHTVALPEDSTRAKGDFEYTMDLAMTDLDGESGFYGQTIGVTLLDDFKDDDSFGLAWIEDARGDTWTENKCIWFYFPTDSNEEGAGDITLCQDPDDLDDGTLPDTLTGDLSLRLSKVGSILTASYKPKDGEWTVVGTIDLETDVPYDEDESDPPTERRYSAWVNLWGERANTWDITHHVVDEIRFKFVPLLLPEITLTDDGMGGDEVDYIAVGSVYTDLGATAVGAPPELADLTEDIVVTGQDDIDTSVVGASFIVAYNLTDVLGVRAEEVTRRVTVVEDKAPVLTLKSETMGDTDFEIVQGGSYVTLTAALTDPTSAYFANDGATAFDQVDGDITPSIVVGGDTLDTDTPGSYTITYNVTDSNGNAAPEASRTVTVTARPSETPDARGAATGDSCFVGAVSANTQQGGSYALMLLLLAGSIAVCLIGGFMKKHWLRLITVLMGIGLVFTHIPSAFAQEDTDIFTLDEITVTAERRETNAQDTPVAVSAWDNTALDEEAINGIEDLQMRMPSTQFTGNKIVMRGVGRDLNQLGMDPGVGIYEDGFYSTEQGALGNLFDVARIEAIRGPQSTLFGRNTIGGLVQIIYTRPTREFSGQAKIELSPQGSNQYLAFGGPLIEDKLMYRIRLRNWDADGQQYNFYDDTTHGGYDGSTVDVFVLYQPTDKLEFYARYWFSTAQNDIGSGIRPDPYNACCTDIWYTYPGDSQTTLVRTMDERGVVWTRNSDKRWGPTQFGGMINPWWNVQGQHNPSSDDPWKNNFDTSGFFDFDGSGVMLTTTYEVSDSATIKLLTEYRDWWWTQHGDADGSADTGYGMEWDVPMSIYQYTGELQFIYGAPGGRLSFIGGIYYYFKHEVQGWIYSAVGTENTKWLYENIENPNDENNPPAAVAGWRPQAKTDPWTGPGTYFAYDTWINTGDTAAYGQVDFQVTDKVNVTAGVRWAQDDKKGYEELDMINTWATNTALYHYTPNANDTDPHNYRWDPETYPPADDYIQDLKDDGQTPMHGSGFLAGQDILLGDPIELGPRRNAYGDNDLPWQYEKPSGTWNGWTSPDNARILGADDTAKWDRFVGKFSIDYKPKEETLLYISYAKGFKAGGFQLGSWAQGELDPAAMVYPLPGQSIPIGEPTVYDPEELASYEFGWKQLWFGDTWRTNLTVYMYDYDELQVEVTVNNETGVRNSGDAEVIGIEFEGEGYVTDHLLVNWATSYADAKYLGFQASDTAFPWEGVQNIDGNTLKRSPAYKFACGGTYTHPTDIGDFSLNLRYYWQSETFFAQYNSWKDRYKAWDRVDARFWWSSPDFKWRATVGMNNIFNSRGVMDVSPGGADDRREWSMISKREWSLELSYRF